MKHFPPVISLVFHENFACINDHYERFLTSARTGRIYGMYDTDVCRAIVPLTIQVHQGCQQSQWPNSGITQ